MKLVIPVAGVGSKLRPHTHTQPKSLVPIAGKPILGHIIDSMLDQSISEFIVIIGYLGEKIKSYLLNEYPELKITFIVQEPRLGLAHAIYQAKELIENEKEIAICLGDTIVNTNIKEFLESEGSALAVKKIESPGRFGVAETDKNGIVKKLVEKPKIPKSNLALVGLYKIASPRKLVQAIEYILENDIRTHNDYHLTDAIMRMIELGEEIKTILVNNWYDCGRKDTLLEANAILLNRVGASVDPREYKNTIIIPPVSIGKNCKISNSIIGPNVAIGESTNIKSSIIGNSIIGSFSELQYSVLENSIVGNDSSLLGLRESLNLGDNTEIHFNT
jgi:glucose-1-phosphate thymidylyltransferase